MAETLQEYEHDLSTLESGALLHGPEVEDDDVGVRFATEEETAALPPRARAAELCRQAYGLQEGLVRTLWSFPYRGQARDLVTRSRDLIGRTMAEADLMGPSIAPRFPATVDPCTGTPRPAVY